MCVCVCVCVCVCRGRVVRFIIRGVMNEIISSLIATIPRVSLTESFGVQNLVKFLS